MFVRLKASVAFATVNRHVPGAPEGEGRVKLSKKERTEVSDPTGKWLLDAYPSEVEEVKVRRRKAKAVATEAEADSGESSEAPDGEQDATEGAEEPDGE